MKKIKRPVSLNSKYSAFQIYHTCTAFPYFMDCIKNFFSDELHEVELCPQNHALLSSIWPKYQGYLDDHDGAQEGTACKLEANVTP